MPHQHATHNHAQPQAGHKPAQPDPAAAFVSAFKQILSEANSGTRSLAALNLSPDATIVEIDQRIAVVREWVALDLLQLAHVHGLTGQQALDAVHQCQQLLQQRIAGITAT